MAPRGAALAFIDDGEPRAKVEEQLLDQLRRPFASTCMSHPMSQGVRLADAIITPWSGNLYAAVTIPLRRISRRLLGQRRFGRRWRYGQRCAQQLLAACACEQRVALLLIDLEGVRRDDRHALGVLREQPVKHRLVVGRDPAIAQREHVAKQADQEFDLNRTEGWMSV